MNRFLRLISFQKCIILLTLLLPTKSYGTKHLVKVGQFCEGGGSLKLMMQDTFDDSWFNAKVAHTVHKMMVIQAFVPGLGRRLDHDIHFLDWLSTKVDAVINNTIQAAHSRLLHSFVVSGFQGIAQSLHLECQIPPAGDLVKE